MYAIRSYYGVQETLETQTPFLSMTLINDTLITGSEDSITTYLINPLSCKLSKLQTVTLNAPAYVIRGDADRLLVGSSDGVHIFSTAASGDISQSAFYETAAPVYDIDLQDERAFLALTAAGARAIDISQPSQPLTLFDFPQVATATEILQAGERLYVADNTREMLMAFTPEGAFLEQPEMKERSYALAYEDSKLYLAMGLDGFGTLRNNFV